MNLIGRNIFLFGTGKLQKTIENECTDLKVIGYFDNETKKHGTIHNGKPVKCPNEIPTLLSRSYLIVIASSCFEDISQQLEDLGLRRNEDYIDGIDLLSVNTARQVLGIHSDMEEEFVEYYLQSRKYTMTSVHRMYAIYKGIEYIVKRGIQGSVVECGVWKGGSAMMCALSLLGQNDNGRMFYLYDTYAGMSEPTEEDVDVQNSNARDTWEKSQNEDYNSWCYSSVEEVKMNFLTTQYPPENVTFVKGKVEDTIPGMIPKQIALLRLDTDWYESTYHELNHLFPLLSKDGVIIIDDYGHWQGVKKAVDEYFESHSITILLNKIDYTGRIGIKG